MSLPPEIAARPAIATPFVIVVAEFIYAAGGCAECDIDPEFGEINCRVNGRRVSPRAYREFIGRASGARPAGTPREIAP